MWTLANNPRVPDPVRREINRWGVCRDEFTSHGGWPTQLYVREARRMIGAYVMTQHHCQGQEKADDPIGMAAYTMDSHNVQRYVAADRFVRNEGDVQVGGFPPFPISYRAITPKASECANLLVPLCLSASHIAFGSIRMEPVFMVLGQSAGTAACQAIDEGVPVQRIDYPKLRQRLLADGQILAFTRPESGATGLDPKKLGGVVVDDADSDLVAMTGFGVVSESVRPFVGAGYRHDNNTGKGRQSITFRADVPADGRYDLRLGYTAHANRASNVPVRVQYPGGTALKTVNERVGPPVNGLFVSLGEYRLQRGTSVSVTVSNQGTDGYVIADAVQIVPVADD
jgi:hypothetical protein